jgi:uncharacterized protein YkwD
MRTRYLDALAAAPKTTAAGTDPRKRVRELRERFLRVRELPEDAMKRQLGEVSMPAIEELRRLLMPTVAELVAAGGPALARHHHAAHEVAKFRDAALEAALATVPSDTGATLAAAEAEMARRAWQLDRDALRVLDRNREIAADENIPAAEAAGIEECNQWRIFVGLNALVIDPKLCAAARDHSKDMAGHGFFSHTSPIPGKTSFTDRARLAGTSASAENIYAGGTDPHGANRGWFFSPGHHKNMFANGHQRIGLGHHDGRWTQMFGN